MHRNQLHFYKLTRQKKEIKESIPFTIALKTRRYLGVNLTKEVKTYTWKTIKHWQKKLMMTQRNGKTFHAHGMKEQTLLKCLCYPKQSTHSMQSLSK